MGLGKQITILHLEESEMAIVKNSNCHVGCYLLPMGPLLKDLQRYCFPTILLNSTSLVGLGNMKSQPDIWKNGDISVP